MSWWSLLRREPNTINYSKCKITVDSGIHKCIEKLKAFRNKNLKWLERVGQTRGFKKKSLSEKTGTSVRHLTFYASR